MPKISLVYGELYRSSLAAARRPKVNMWGNEMVINSSKS